MSFDFTSVSLVSQLTTVQTVPIAAGVDAVWLKFTETGGKDLLSGIIALSGSGRTLKGLGVNPAVMSGALSINLLLMGGDNVQVSPTAGGASIGLQPGDQITLQANLSGDFTPTLTFTSSFVRIDLLLTTSYILGKCGIHTCLPMINVTSTVVS